MPTVKLTVIHSKELNYKLKSYPKAYECIQKIELYVKEQFKCELSIDKENY